MAARTRGSICLLHVIDRLASSVASGSKLGATEPLEARQDRSEIARIELGRRMLADSRSRIAITGDIVFGAGATTIAAYAADHAFDLIVMGTRGHGGIPHLVMGSVDEAVIRTARCPVLTVKSAAAAQRHEVTAEPAYAGV
jgi:nucleotide-binding universal stress UspA family protein